MRDVITDLCLLIDLSGPRDTNFLPSRNHSQFTVPAMLLPTIIVGKPITKREEGCRHTGSENKMTNTPEDDGSQQHVANSLACGVVCGINQCIIITSAATAHDGDSL
ncbi:hypothetical protein ElyMa_003411300 [Elysia marginata]|uniref:Uncharacterized protein n=1 Tax=Elysia marginata TaxID=1093978 RepID=A0AAV4JN94_9GAST|nr:hypothetical protein ElyMa_003411300 [Elysia marginata]